MLTTASGKEIIISHSTDNDNLQVLTRNNINSGPWTQQAIPNNLTNGYLVWNRATIGGQNREYVHMIAVTAPTVFGNAAFNGLDGALLYYRSPDGGTTWDIVEMQLPTVDSINFNGINGDEYAIDAKGDTVVIAVFNDFEDSFILKSTNNGINWLRQNFIDFPTDKYQIDSGLDFNNDGINDQFYSTDNYGSLSIDKNGNAHVFYGNMRYADDNLFDATTNYFPNTNGLMYWSEYMGFDDGVYQPLDSGVAAVWTPKKPIRIAEAMDLNGDGKVEGIDFSVNGSAIYYSSLSSMPSSSIDNKGNIFVTYSSYNENDNNGMQNYRSINIIKSSNNGSSWSCPIDVSTANNLNMHSQNREDVYPSISKELNSEYLNFIFMSDYEPGISVRGDNDNIDFNDIMLAQIDTNNLSFVNPGIIGCTDPNSTNYDSLATLDDGSCLICDLTYNPIVQHNTPGLCDGFILVLSTSSHQPINYQWGNGSTMNNITNICDSIYNITVIDSIGCEISDTIVIGTISGCTDSTALNYNPFANFDDSSCFYCDLNINLNIIQNTSGSCNGAALITNINTSFPPYNYQWSTGSTTNNITQLCNGLYFINVSDSIGCSFVDTFYINSNPPITGCTDPLATNYDPLATVDDGSCTYTVSCSSPSITGLGVSNVIHDRATLTFDDMNSSSCRVDQLRIKYREVGTSAWSQKNMGSPTGYDPVTGICNSTSRTDKLLLGYHPIRPMSGR